MRDDGSHRHQWLVTLDNRSHHHYPFATVMRQQIIRRQGENDSQRREGGARGGDRSLEWRREPLGRIEHRTESCVVSMPAKQTWQREASAEGSL